MEVFNAIAHHWNDILIAIGAIGVAAESLLVALAVLVRVIKKISDWAYGLAGLTATQVDDSIFWRASVILGAVADWLDRAAAWVPRLRPASKAKKPGPGLGTSALTGVLVGLIAVGMVGCGGKAERGVRTALDVSARALVEVDALGVLEVQRAEVRCESETTYEAWRECMSDVRKLRNALVSARSMLLAAEGAVDASGADGILGIAGCISHALNDVDAAMKALVIPVPPSVQTAIDGLRAWGQLCNYRPEDAR